jgi:hypothetical protein
MVASPPEGGITSPSPGEHTYAWDTTVAVSAGARFGWGFDYWSGACSGDEADTTVYMNADKTCTAHFDCAPIIPGTYNGSVLLNGSAAPDDTLVEGFINGVKWAQDTTSGGNYVFDMPGTLPTEPPCFEGGQITFYADGVICVPQVQWQSSLHAVDLTCG